ncbi:MAG TPA: GNAT family N-acetyltransferase, partial [Planctomycetota bacterium]|nr:GNAT family N-acetyltransferase [Planctomycetota bacterium]
RLETARLVLRPPMAKDFEAWAGFYADPECALHIGGVQDRATAWRSLAVMVGSWSLRGFSMFSVIEKSSGEWIGRLGPWQPEGWPGTEVGWGLRRKSWGQGYALEGAIAAIDWAFGALPWTEVVHTIRPDNVASQRLAARLGSVERGPTQLPGQFAHIPVRLWSQTRAQWFARAR